jgi:hypothetical protein
MSTKSEGLKEPVVQGYKLMFVPVLAVAKREDMAVYQYALSRLLRTSQ